MTDTTSIDGKATCRIAASYLIVVLVLAVPIPAIMSSQGTTVIDFAGSVVESLEDMDEDGLAEYLVLMVGVNVYEAGTYILHGAIGADRVAASQGPVVLNIGRHDLKLSFSGGDISLYGVSGHYRVRLELYSTISTIDPAVLDLVTLDPYGPEMFEAPQGSGKVSVRTESDMVYVIGDPLTLSVNQTFPKLHFYYTADEGKGSSTSLTYRTLLAFDDMDGDGIWDDDSDELKYEGDLTRVEWELDLDVKDGVEISLYGVVQMRLAGTATVAAWAKVTFRLSSTLLLKTYSSQKFDIDIDLWQPLDATHLALLHTLRDETGSRKVVDVPIDESEGQPVRELRVVDRRGRTQNNYSWTDDITVGYSSPDRVSKAVSWSVLGDGEADVWFSYPLDGDVQMIHHDPTVGVDPDFVPPRPGGEDFIHNSLVVMIVGLFIGIIVVGATLYSKRVAAGKRKGGGP